MVLWMNVKEAREQLLKYHFVFTLRPKKGRLIGKKLRGFDTLMYGGFGKKGVVYFVYIEEVAVRGGLDEYVTYSGFRTTKEWWIKAKGSRFLYLVVLLESRVFLPRLPSVVAGIVAGRL